jgi:probable HAF family extracellular repeat protein
MKKSLTNTTLAIMLLAVTVVSIQLGAQGQSATQEGGKQSRYKFVDLGTFGGPESWFYGWDHLRAAHVFNNEGRLTGWAETPERDPSSDPNFCWDGDCFVAHTYRWQDGRMEDLGALPGGASSDSRWISENGLIAGDSQNGDLDPLNSGFPQIRAVLWKDGQIIDLGTLEGGYESLGYAVNSRGQAIGMSLTTVPDPDSIMGAIYGWPQQTRAFLWENGSMRDLGTLGSGTNAIALMLNESGQVAGYSYTGSDPSPGCPFPLVTSSFLWQNGTMVDLGTLGGTCTLVSDLNNRGQAVGVSNLAGDETRHPFLWQQGVIKDLGTLGGEGAAVAVNEAGVAAGWSNRKGNTVTRATLWNGDKVTDLGTVGQDPCSIADAINSKGQVIGFSGDCNFEDLNAFLWEPGKGMTNLNDFVPPEFDLHLRVAWAINDRGEIAGIGRFPDGVHHTFVLVPCGDDLHADWEGCRSPRSRSDATSGKVQLPTIQSGASAHSGPRPFRAFHRWHDSDVNLVSKRH